MVADIKIKIILLQICNSLSVLQMVEIQSDSSLYSVQNLGYAYLEDGNETIEDMKDHHKKLLELKAMLKEQQTMMMAAIANVERIKKGTVIPIGLAGFGSSLLLPSMAQRLKENVMRKVCVKHIVVNCIG